MTEPHDDLIEKVARAIAPEIFFQFDACTMDQALNWDKHSEKDRDTIKRIANEALEASGLSNLEARVARYADALGKIVSIDDPTPNATASIMRSIARAALDAGDK
jgi:hypothetical protein